MTNLHRFNIGHRININKQWQLTGDYHALWADQNSGAVIRLADQRCPPTRSSAAVCYATSLRYKFSDQLYGHFLSSTSCPASYYVAPSDDDAWFFRVNFEYIF